jgi:GAF domain-containing protein
LGRSFSPGDGHVGFAFTKSQEIYTGDATTGEARQISAIKSGENRAYDDTAYRSFASIPIIAFDTTLPRSIGVLVATSSQTGRFDRFNGRVLVHAAKALALLFTKYDLSSVSISTPAQEGPNG